MPSSWPETSSPDRRAVIVTALSARALAQSAARAGYAPIVLDLFCDLDARAAALEARRLPGSIEEGLDAEALLGAVAAVARQQGANLAGLVYGGGFENRPGRLAKLREVTSLLGNSPATVARCKDPGTFFPLLDRLEIAHPEVSPDPPKDLAGWLVKRAGASGGSHVQPLGSGLVGSDSYFQRRVPGRPVSLAFLADGSGACLVGLSEQWASPGGDGFRYGGAVQPAELSAGLAGELAGAVARLVPAFGLKGLNSADFLIRERDFDLLEINPRPGASLDVFDRRGAGLFAAHCAACRGRLDKPAAAADGAADGAMAAAVVYAPERLSIPASFRWPAWAADLPESNSVIEPGAPLCSVQAEAASPKRARAEVNARGEEILTRLRGSRPSSVPRQTGAAAVS